METKKVEEILEEIIEEKRRYFMPIIFLIDDRYFYANRVCECFIEELLRPQNDGILAWGNPSVSIITFGGTVERPTGKLTVSCEEALNIINHINQRTMSKMSEARTISISKEASPVFEAKSLFGQALRELDGLLTNMENEYAKSRFSHPKIILIGDGHFDDDWEDALRILEENSVFRRCFRSKILEEDYMLPYYISVASVPVGESPNKDALIRFSDTDGYCSCYGAGDAFCKLTTIYD